MAAPDIVNITSMYGKTTAAAVAATIGSVLTNSAASGKVYKINSILVSNIDGTNSVNVSVTFYRSSTDYYIGKDILVPGKSTVTMLEKTQMIYLEEGDAIRAVASAASDAEIIVSYEEVS